jgi:hypothetical protein
MFDVRASYEQLQRKYYLLTPLRRWLYYLSRTFFHNGVSVQYSENNPLLFLVLRGYVLLLVQLTKP